MKKQIITLSVLLFSLLNIQAQGVKLTIQTGYGFYDMSTLKPFTQEIINQLPFEAKVISNYPPYFYYQPSLKFCMKYLELGLSYTFQTTGSRISSKDYSGEYRFDTKINGNSLGIFLGSVQPQTKKWKINYNLQFGMNFSTFKTEEYIKLDTISNKEFSKFTGNSFFVAPGLSISYPIYKNLSIGADVSYYKEVYRFDYYGVQSTNGEIPVEKKFLKPDQWDGFRAGISVTIILNKKEKQ